MLDLKVQMSPAQCHGLCFFHRRGILDKPMIIKELVKEMRTQGVDIFPDYDSHCYIEGQI
jgi:hypothetical protein